MTPADLAESVLDAVRRSVADGDLSVTVPGEIRLVRPRVREHGDYATGVALELAGAARRPPREIAEVVAERLRAQAGIGSVEVAGPGFLNISVVAGSVTTVLRDVLARGAAYGRTNALAGQRVSLRFAPADRPDTVRWTAVGPALGRVLGAAGATVTSVDGAGASVEPAEPAGPGEPLGPRSCGQVRLAGRPAPALAAVVDAVGVDAARYALVRSPLLRTDLDIDVDRWNRRTWDNPLFTVQYAHARAASLRRNAHDLGIALGDPLAEPPTVDFDLLGHDRERELLRALGEFPQVVARAARHRAVHRVTRYLEDLADTYHRCGETCPALPKGDQPVTPLMVSRLWLCEATRTVLANGLGLLGVRTPDRL